MAIDLTTDFSAHFLDIPEEDTTLSNLVDQDDSLPLPTNFIQSPVNDTNSSNGSTSEITFLGCQLSASATDSVSLSEKKPKVNNTAPKYIGNETEEILGEFSHTNNEIDIETDDDDFSGRFNIMDQLSQKIEAGTMLTEPISNLLEADQQPTEELSKMIPFEDMAPDEDEKTENFLLDNTETFLSSSNHNISGMVNFSGTTCGLRETPMQTPLNLNRQPTSDAVSSVDDFLSRVHVHFRIFDVINRNVGNAMAKTDGRIYEEEEILSAMLEQQLVLNSRLALLSSKNEFYESEIGNIKEQIQKLTETLENNKPKCFEMTILCRKQLKDIKKLAQTYSKQCWYEERIKVHQEFQKYLQSTLELLQYKGDVLQDQLISTEYPIYSTSVLDENSSFSEEAIRSQQMTVARLSDEYEILSSIPSWKLTEMPDSSVISFMVGDNCKLEVQVGDMITGKFSISENDNSSNFMKQLLRSIDIEAYCNVSSVRLLSSGLEDVNLWYGRAEDLLDECKRIEALENVSVNLDIISSDDIPTVSTTITEGSLFAPHNEVVEILWKIQLKQYPQLTFVLENQDDELESIIQNTLDNITPISKFPFGRLEEVCRVLAQ